MFFVKKKKIAGDLSTSQGKSDNYCLDFFFSLLEKHKSKIITSLYREFIQFLENIYFVMKNMTSKEDIWNILSMCLKGLPYP